MTLVPSSKRFDIRDHYWRLADQVGAFWSSKRAQLVALDDPIYTAWRQPNDITTTIASAAELIEVLTRAAMPTIGLAGATPPRAELPKSTVMSRVFALGKADAIKALFDANFQLQSQWFTPDWPNVYVDDAGLLSALGAIGLTSDEIAVVTAPV